MWKGLGGELMFRRDWLKWLVDKEKSNSSRLTKTQWLMVLGCIGAALILLSSFFQSKPVPHPPPEQPQAVQPALADKQREWSISDYEQAYEEQLKEILQEVVGVGRVSVMVNLDSTPEKVVDKDAQDRRQTTRERDSQGATRDIEDQSRDRQTVIVSGGEGTAPLIIKERKPEVRGVLVVAEGAEQPQVKIWITEAVRKVLDVPANRITVLPRKSGTIQHP